MENIKNEKGNVIEMTENINGKIQNIDDYEDIGLDEVVEKCSEFLKGEIKEEEFKRWSDKIFVLYYLPLMDKHEIIYDFLFDKIIYENISKYSEDIQIELGKWFYMMLAYTNIQINGFEDYITIENYDITVRCLSNIIKLICGEDYSRLIDMYNSIMSVENIKDIMQMISDLPIEGQDNSALQIKEVLEKLNENKDSLIELSELINFKGKKNKEN